MSEGSIATSIGYESMLENLKEQALSKIGTDKLAKANAVLSQLSQANMLLNHYDFYNKIAEALNEKAQGVAKTIKDKIGEKLGTSEGETGIIEKLSGLKQAVEEKVGDTTQLVSKAKAFISDPKQALTDAVLENLGVKAEDGSELTSFLTSQIKNVKNQSQVFNDFVRMSQPFKDRLDELQNSRDVIENKFNEARNSLLDEKNEIEDRYADYVNNLYDREGRLPSDEEMIPWKREADRVIKNYDLTKQKYLDDDSNVVDEITARQQDLQDMAKSMFGSIEGYNPEQGIFANLANIDKPTLSSLFEPEAMTRFEGLSPYLGQFTDTSFIEKAKQLVQSPVREGLNADMVDNVRKAFSENADKVLQSGKEQAMEEFNSIRSGVVENYNNVKAIAEQQIDNATQKIQQGVEAVNQARSNASELINQGQQALSDAKNAIVNETTSFAQTGEQMSQGLKEGGQALGKFVGGEGGEAIQAGTEAVSSAIPVIGEVIDAGLIISSLVTGIVDIFKNRSHTQPVSQVSQQYGI